MSSGWPADGPADPDYHRGLVKIHFSRAHVILFIKQTGVGWFAAASFGYIQTNPHQSIFSYLNRSKSRLPLREALIKRAFWPELISLLKT